MDAPSDGDGCKQKIREKQNTFPFVTSNKPVLYFNE